MRVSQATRPAGSSSRTASRTASEIWSAILSGWPSVTDSELKVISPGTGTASSFGIARRLDDRCPLAARSAGELVRRNALQQGAQGVGQRHAVDEAADGLGDRQVDPVLAAPAAAAPAPWPGPRRPCRSSPRRASGGTPAASSSPARRLREWRDVQVATRSPMPARPGVGAGVGAEGRPQARHLGQPARDQRRLGVVAVAERVRDARGDARSRSWPRRRARTPTASVEA